MSNGQEIAVAEESFTATLTEQQQELLDMWLSMSREKRRVLWRVFDAYEKASTPEEEKEIRDSIAEAAFRSPLTVATKSIEQLDVPSKGFVDLEHHRKWVGIQIKKYRSKAGFTQEQLAKRAGMPQSHVSRLECGKHAATYLTISKIADELGVDPGLLDPTYG